MNSVVLLGRIVFDPELKTTPNGKEVINFRIAVDKPYQKDSERGVDFFDVVAWGKTAAFIAQYFTKGKPIVVIGSLQTRTYEAKDGSNCHVTEILANSVEFVPNSKKDDTAQNSGYSEPNYTAPAAPPQMDSLLDDTKSSDVVIVGAEDDLPF